jgi:DNA-binding NtrC family response regulator
VVQAKLLKVLEDQRFRRVGGTQDRRVSVRVVSATSRDLEAMVARGEFRRDLYFRLAGVVIDMPALRDRRDEVPRLVDDVLRDLGLHPTHRFSDEAVAVLVSHDWPGNVRELRNVVERAACSPASR